MTRTPSPLALLVAFTAALAIANAALLLVRVRWAALLDNGTVRLVAGAVAFLLLFYALAVLPALLFTPQN